MFHQGAALALHRPHRCPVDQQHSYQCAVHRRQPDVALHQPVVVHHPRNPAEVDQPVQPLPAFSPHAPDPSPGGRHRQSHKKVELQIEEIALGYQQTLGRHLNDQYCERCHNPESTVERVSNYDNLEVKPHPFTEGDTLNKISDADLTAIISHGGPALNKSALMPAWGNTVSKSDIQALISYIRAVSDPPSRRPGQDNEQY